MAHEPEELASIDDLLAASEYPEEPPARTGNGTFLVRLVRSAMVATICAGAVYVVLLPLGLKVPYPLLFSVFFALIAVRRAVRTVAAPRQKTGAMPAAPVIGGVNPDDVADGIRLAVSRWEARLSWIRRDPQRFESTVRVRLAEITDERLRQRHGISRTTDPRRAREMMGDRLWEFLFLPLSRTPNPHELAAVVDDMETL
jgi:hypothetical protein